MTNDFCLGLAFSYVELTCKPLLLSKDGIGTFEYEAYLSLPAWTSHVVAHFLVFTLRGKHSKRSLSLLT
jgi:hypothetical protein